MRKGNKSARDPNKIYDYGSLTLHLQTTRVKMSRKTNEKIERYYFEQFRKVYRLPDGMVKHGDKPDIIIDGNKKIGIEVTNSYIENGALPESEQNQKKGREDVLSKAQQQYLANNGKRIEISFSFNKACPIRNKKN